MRFILALAVALMCAAPATAAAAQNPQQQDEYKPLSQLPPQEQLQSGPLLIGAYSFVLIMLFLYVGSVARRLTTVQREVERLESDLKRTKA